jgi:hypothetical protein
MTTPLSAFLPFLMIAVPGASEPLAEQAVLHATRQFCERTRLWRETSTHAVVADTPVTVTWAPPATLHEIERVWFDDRRLDPTQFQAEPPNAQPDYTVAFATPNALTLRAPAAGTFRVVALLKPTLSALEVPDFLYENHAEAIASGALARLLAMPGQVWRDDQAALMHEARFEAAVTRLYGSNLSGQQRAPIRSKPWP